MWRDHSNILYWGYIGKMEENMETIIIGGDIGAEEGLGFSWGLGLPETLNRKPCTLNPKP